MAGGVHQFLLRLKSFFRRRRLDREMGEELEFHQAMLREKLLREGTPQAEIQAATRRTFGNPARWHEHLRELWQFRALQNLLRDLSFSTRLLAKSPGFTVVALLTLALGVGANTAGYLPITQSPAKKPSYTAVVRLEGPPGPLPAAARSLAARLAPDIPAPIMTTMSGVIDDSLRAERMMAILAVFFAGCALLVTAIGLYGTLAYTTERRTSEIGIRMALGAQRRQIVFMVFRENAAIAATGSAAGLITALLASRALASLLYGTSPFDPAVLVLSMLALAAVASAASLLPTVRAARIQPMTAIRSE